MASATLSVAERNYSQLHKEALAVVFAVQKFHKYLYGYPFTIYSDHKPLEILLGDKKGLSVVSSVRLHRWILILSNYQFQLKFRPGSKQKHVDALSRLPISDPTNVEELTLSLNHFNFTNALPISIKDVAKATQEDKVLKNIKDFVLKGWPAECKNNPAFSNFYRLRCSIEYENSCLFYGNRLIIPDLFRKKILEMLHEKHIGIVRMKMLARTLVWWIKIDRDIEYVVSNCKECQRDRRKTKDWKFYMAKNEFSF